MADLNKKIIVDDASGDRKYFTLVPHYVLNHSTIYDREVYIQMKRIAGEGGLCYMSEVNLAKQCGISRDRLRKSIKYLIEHKWIESVDGDQPNKYNPHGFGSRKYKIVDIWQLNINHYSKDIPNLSLNAKSNTPNLSSDIQEPVVRHTERKTKKEEPRISVRATDVAEGEEGDNQIFNLEEYLEKMYRAKDPRMPIVALYWRKKNFKFDSVKSVRDALMRELRPAKVLVGRDARSIELTMDYLNSDNYPGDKWTLETVFKYIDDLANIKAKLQAKGNTSNVKFVDLKALAASNKNGKN
jgi:hypothetical protein